MGFKVEVTDLAREDIEEAIDYISTDSRIAASNWKSGLETLILSLGEMPGRFAIIPESAELKKTYRSAVYHSHRVIFRIDEQEHIVYVVRVYHGARRPLIHLNIE